MKVTVPSTAADMSVAAKALSNTSTTNTATIHIKATLGTVYVLRSVDTVPTAQTVVDEGFPILAAQNEDRVIFDPNGNPDLSTYYAAVIGAVDGELRLLW
jgi:hypothetical protein